MKNLLRAGAIAAFARAFFNLIQPLYIGIYMQRIPEGQQYVPAVLSANRVLFYIEMILMIGMGLGLVLAVWALFDLMKDKIYGMMRLSLATAMICGGSIFLVAAIAVTRVDGLFLIEDFPMEQQVLALHFLDLLSVMVGHVMVSSQSLSTLFWSYSVFKTAIFSRSFALTGLVIGALGIAFEFTPFNLLGFLVQVPLFIWLGVAFLRKQRWTEVELAPAA